MQTKEFFTFGWLQPGSHIGGSGDRLFTAVPSDKIARRKVSIEGFEDCDIVLHRPTVFIGDDVAFGKKGWTASEGRSGFKLVEGDTQLDALARLEAALGKHGRDGFEADIQRAIAEHRLSPRYTQEALP